MHTQSLGQLAPAVLTSGSRHTLALGASQAGNEVFAQLASRHGVNAVVGGLMLDGALGVVGPHELECASDLKRRPALVQKVTHHAKEQRVRGQLRAAPSFETLKTSSRARSTSIVSAMPHSLRLRLGVSHRFIAAVPIGETMQFTGNGRGRAMQGAGYVARRALLLTHDHDGGSFFRGELFVMCSHGSTLLDGCCT